MEKGIRSVSAEILCFAVDSGGYYSELQEFNFVAELDVKAPIKESFAEAAHSGLGFGDASFNFRCYSANFLGDHIDLTLRPLQVKYIEESLREQKSVILYLCKDVLHSSAAVENRKNSVTIISTPSMLAHQFLHSTCGSVSGYESDLISDGASGATGSIYDGDDDSVFPVSPLHDRKNRPTRQMTIFASRSPPLSPYKGQTMSAKPPLSKAITAPQIKTLPPAQANSPPSHTLHHLGVIPTQQKKHSKSPLSSLWSPKRNKPTFHTLHPHVPPSQNKIVKSGASSSGYNEPVINPGHIISSPITRPTGPIPTTSKPSSDIAVPVTSKLGQDRRLHRADAIKRRSLNDLGVSLLFYDFSSSTIPVIWHFSDHRLEGSQYSSNEALTLYITIYNHVTVGELKSRICNKIQEQTNFSVLPSSLLVYYSYDGEDYELFIESQFIFHTFFHELLVQGGSSTTGPTVLQAKVSKRLPEKELRVLYRISQLTGVLLEDDVSTQAVDTRSLTVLPVCDQEEVHNARRCLHSYMKRVVAERDEEAYCSCRDISSREASMQLSLMTPTDNLLTITFHYKTDFSLKRKLIIHTFADKALSDLFPCLVASGLVRDKIEDYTLQVSGEESYIFGAIELIAFRHIRKCIVKSEPIHLSVTEKPPIEMERPHQFSLLSVDPLSSVAMDHYELSHLRPISQEGVCSAWEIDNKLRLIRLQIEGLPPISRRGTKVHLELRLLHGCKSLCSSVTSSCKVAESNLTWNEHLEFDIEIRDIPKAARIMVMVVEGRNSQAERKSFLFWGMISVFDSSGRLRAGDAELRLWKGGENRRTGDSVVHPNLATHPANNPTHNAVRLTLGFNVILSKPIVYPSTREESRSVFTRQHPSFTNVPARKQFRTMLQTIQREKLYKAVPAYARRSSKLSEMLELFYALDQLQDSIDDIPDHVALRLLDSDFPEEHVRVFAVRALETLSDEQLEDYLLQLVQALKFEASHDSALARFLLKKALNNKTIGHFFFWYLKSEMHSRLHMVRFAIILEAYLKGCGESMLTRFTDQVDIQNSLCDMAVKLRKECDNGTDLEKMQSLLPSYLEELGTPRFLFIPVHNPRNVLGKLKPQKCKVMCSKKRPMWLEMYNIHGSALRQSPIRLILKLGDDLRQDMITLRMFSLFEKLWEEQGLDLELIPYGCMATGPQTGFIEVVKNARTIKEVSSVTNSFKLFEWIKSHQENEFGETDNEMLNAAVKRFTRSCAGYSVATYVLGIGDRHNDNIMVTTSGNLFHIDFGHFLGHIKYFMGFKREWAPFVLTPDFVYVMGGENSEMFETYKNLCCRAFLTLRRNADLIINLFSLMRSTGIPELTCVEDTNYIRNVLEIDLAVSEHVAETRFRKVIQKCLNLKWTVQIMWRLHIAKNGSE